MTQPRRSPCWFVAATLAIVCAGSSGALAQATPKGAAQTSAKAAAPKGAAELERAYRREFAFLEAERNALQQRIAAVEREGQRKTAAARSAVEALQGRVMSVSLEADQLQERLQDAEREVEGSSEGEDVVDNILNQAQAALDRGGVELPELEPDHPDGKLKQLQFAFGQALTLLPRFSRVREEPGAFFAADGTRVEGQLIKVGQVAAFGVADHAAGALAPAGAGDLKVWPQQPSAATARALARGEHPPSLQVFLFEALDKPVESKATQSIEEHIASGGIIAWVIVGAGLLAMLMIVARAGLLWRAAANTEKLVDEISPLVAHGNVRKAVEVCRRAKNASGRVLKATLEHIDRSRDELEDIVSEAVLHEQPVLDRFGSAIMVLAAVSPLLGLLGTVTGMISTFDVITEFGTGNPKLLSGGISEALVTTELGLIVAIPALLCGNMLSGWADRIKDDMDKSALRITNLVNGIRVSQFPPAVAPDTGSSEPGMVTT